MHSGKLWPGRLCVLLSRDVAQIAFVRDCALQRKIPVSPNVHNALEPGL